MKLQITRDETDLIFRALFCLIFIGLGGEHIVSDELIQHLMPSWVPFPRIASIACGIWLILWGSFVLLGFRLRIAAFNLGIFLVVVTAVVHIPGALMAPPVPDEYSWMWTVLQRSNLVKNLCLLGVCFHLFHYELGKYSVEKWIARKEKS